MWLYDAPEAQLGPAEAECRRQVESVLVFFTVEHEDVSTVQQLAGVGS